MSEHYIDGITPMNRAFWGSALSLSGLVAPPIALAGLRESDYITSKEMLDHLSTAGAIGVATFMAGMLATWYYAKKAC